MKILIILIFGLMCTNAYSAPEKKIFLAKNGKSLIGIALPSHPSEARKFAGLELSRYLQQISGAVFHLHQITDNSTSQIIIEQNKILGKEDYHIDIKGQNIVLSGGSDRAILYAVYDFLHRLGCKWLAPGFAFYDGSSEYVPEKTVLFYRSLQNVYEHPRFSYRKLDVEEGRSHNLENLKQLIEWMPKMRFNILMIPLDYGGGGRVQWDKWRKELTPELKKRDLIIEVGGHGYQNFLNAAMKDSTLFQQHPDWFGKDKNCNPSPDPYLVFNTSNPGAVQYLISNVLKYIRQHQEVDIFDFWPPDGARWADCPEFASLGLPVDRQALLVNQVDAAIAKIRPDVRLEMIAYQPVLLPPGKVQLNKNILVDFCPINQSFEIQIYDSSNLNNSNYRKAIDQWRQSFAGDIGLYSYFRKYAWHSLPNVIPHFLQRDMEWYAKVPLQGISSYAEPGDWFTYELNYFVLGHLAWNPFVNVDSLISQYGNTRYGPAWKTTRLAYTALENIVPVYCSIPFTKLKSIRQLQKADATIVAQILNVENERKKSVGAELTANLSRLLLMLKYVHFDLKIEIEIAAHATKETIQSDMKDLLLFLKVNKDKGVFIFSEKNDLPWLMKHYKFNLKQE